MDFTAHVLNFNYSNNYVIIIIKCAFWCVHSSRKVLQQTSASHLCVSVCFFLVPQSLSLFNTNAVYRFICLKKWIVKRVFRVGVFVSGDLILVFC